MKLLSHFQLFATPWTVTYQDPLSMGLQRVGQDRATSRFKRDIIGMGLLGSFYC